MWKRLGEFPFIHDKTNPINNQGVSSPWLEVCKQRRVFFNSQACFRRERSFASPQNSPRPLSGPCCGSEQKPKSSQRLTPLCVWSCCLPGDSRLHSSRTAATMAPTTCFSYSKAPAFLPLHLGPVLSPPATPRNLGRPMTLVEVTLCDFQTWVRKGDKSLSSSLCMFPLGAQSPWCEEAQAT